MLMRNRSSGAFELYDNGNNQITNAVSMGQVGTEWSVAGIAADPPGRGSYECPSGAGDGVDGHERGR